MEPRPIMRVARPTDRLSAVSTMYSQGLGLEILSRFVDHEGFDGVVLGLPGAPYHIEFTTQKGHSVGTAPTKDHLLVFYVQDEAERQQYCEKMISAGFKKVESYNPYWDSNGKTFEDVDGYRVVLQNEKWAK